MSPNLEEYHVKLEAMMAEGDAMMAARDPAVSAAAKRRIAETMLLIASYQMYVHRAVFAPLRTRRNQSRRDRVNELKVECIALTEDLRFNIRDFLAKEEALDWDLTAAKVLWFNGRVRVHIAAARRLMTPGLTDADCARLRASRIGSVGVAAA